ncbi:DNA-binding transcriptional regulator GbsR (MarR family) [Gracilibacillus halotolerans]|uniref:HTH-type transcriptional regulator n=1 Tax=Gracilibacillus halotolerans TaxID=74386 RepID=A0A841REE0_9BACI|nr:transcriptional regulator [Gracilibacillus halotolerans]MBB6512380.1 DNA-binding transcriptional regulator GbsR (MarR family) [Gracilibacillus halotolerans]
MNQHYEETKDQLITEFTKTIELFGLSTLESRLFAYLYITNEPKTLDEMSEALGKSKTAMSTNIRSLAHLNLVSQVWKKGVRRDMYKANSQLFKLFINFYMRKWIDSTTQQKENLEELVVEANKLNQSDEDTKEHTELILRIDDIMKFHDDLLVTFNELRKGVR